MQQQVVSKFQSVGGPEEVDASYVGEEHMVSVGIRSCVVCSWPSLPRPPVSSGGVGGGSGDLGVRLWLSPPALAAAVIFWTCFERGCHCSLPHIRSE